ncbi:hypothetical protein RF11_09746 [Thelohanellus kitauei]|uniref:F-box domain-containing protein n=1 Tax=Thelohanellus kitauei TaxID=669202 RepID=A0A0C2MZ67_THEKT|nr:hypothetical protein RF11_09746 [Thelohanellus kitauei]
MEDNDSGIPIVPIINKQNIMEKYGLNAKAIKLTPIRCRYIRPLPVDTDNINDDDEHFPESILKNICKYLSIWEILDLRFLNQYFNKACVDISRHHPQWLTTKISFLNIQTLKIIVYFQPQVLNLSNNAKINPEFIRNIAAYSPRIKCLILENSDISFINEIDFFILNRLNLEKVIMPYTKASCDTIGKFFSFDVPRNMIFLKHIDIRGHKLSPNLLAFIVKVFGRLQFLDISECVFDVRVLINLLKETTKRKVLLTIKVSQVLNFNPALLEKNINFTTA